MPRKTVTKLNLNTGRNETVTEDPTAPDLSLVHEQGAAAEAGVGQRDPFAPELSDFPNPGGLAGVAMQNKAYKEALAKYQSDPDFKAQFAAAKKKAAEEAMSAQSAKANRQGMR